MPPAAPTSRRTLQSWLAAAAVTWLLVYLVVFYASERLHWLPLAVVLLPDQLVLQWIGGSFARVGLVDRLGVLAVALGFLVLATLAGDWLLRRLRCESRLSRLERCLLGCGVGWNLLATWTLAAGLAGQSNRGWLVLGPPLALGALSALELARRRTATRAGGGQQDRGRDAGSAETAGEAGEETAGHAPGDTPREATGDATDGGWMARYGLWLVLPPALVILLGGVLPPWEFDVREYHLQVPKEWFLQGRIDFLPHNVYGNMPLGAEMAALWGMVAWPGVEPWWWGALAGKLVIASAAPLTALALYATGRRFFSRRAGVIAAVVYLAVPWIAHVSMAGLIDGVVGFYTALAAHAWLLYREDARREPDDKPAAARRSLRLAALCGLLAGAGVACKYPALVFLVIPVGAGILWEVIRAGRTRRLAQPAVDILPTRLLPTRLLPTRLLPVHVLPIHVLAVYLLAVVLACGLWFGKNAVLTGNPSYPLLASVFDGATRTPQKDARWREAHDVPGQGLLDRYGPRPLWASVQRVGWRSEWLSPLIVPLGLLALLSARRWPVVLPLLAWLGFGVAAWWLATHRIDRFLVPMLPLAALLAGAGAGWNRATAWRGLVTGLVVGNVLTTSLIISSRGFPADNRLLMALREFRPDLEHPADPGFAFTDPVHAWLNENVAPGQRVLLVGDAQPFDLSVPVLYNTCFDDCRLEQLLAGAKTAEERRAALAQADVQFVYVKWAELDRYRSPGNYGYSDFATRALIREQLVGEQQVLRQVNLPIHPERAELFELIRAGRDSN